jgi:hypothetical protein
MANGNDESKKSPPPPPPVPPSGPNVPGGGVKPKDVYEPPQTKILLVAGIGGAVGGLAGALLGSCLHHY